VSSGNNNNNNNNKFGDEIKIIALSLMLRVVTDTRNCK
jgi:hypothetical protein